MSTWTDHTPDVDLFGRTVRVIDDTGRIVTAGRATHPVLITHPDDPTRIGVELIADPDADGLDARARAMARRMLTAGQEQADHCPCPDTHTGGVTCWLLPGYTLQLLEPEG